MDLSFDLEFLIHRRSLQSLQNVKSEAVKTGRGPPSYSNAAMQLAPACAQLHVRGQTSLYVVCMYTVK